MISHFDPNTPIDPNQDRTQIALALITRLQVASRDGRRAIQKRRWDLLNDDVDDHINWALVERFKDPDSREHIRKFLDKSNNAYRAIIEKISTVYKEPPRRKFKHDKDTKLFIDVVDIDDLDLAMEEVNRITMALNECLVMPVLRDDKVEFDIITPDSCEVLAAGLNILAIVYFVDEGYMFYDREVCQLFTQEGEPVGNPVPHGLGEVPVVTYRRKRPAKGFWMGRAGEDLVDSYIGQVIYRSWINGIGFFQSHKELGKKPSNTGYDPRHGQKKEEHQAGPSVIHDGDFTVLDLRTDVGPHLDVAEGKLRRTAANWGISSEALSQSKLSSGLERLLTHSSLNEVRLSTIKLFRPADKRLMILVTKVYNVSNPVRRFSEPDKLKPRIDYTEPRLVESPKDQESLLQEQMKTGTRSPVDRVMELNPDIESREEALETIKRNLEEIGVVLTARRSFSEPTEKAAELGAIGGKASGIARKPPANVADNETHTTETETEEE